jgi:RND superfamily putative drug exporter
VASLLACLAHFSARRAWAVIGAWVVILGIAIGAFLAASAPLTNSFDIPGTASGAVTDELAQKLPDTAGGTGTVVFRTDDGAPLTAEQQDQISELTASAADLDGVAAVVDPFESEQSFADQSQKLDDGQAQLASSREQLASGQEQLDAGRTQLAAVQQQLTAAREQAVSAGAPAEQLAALDAQQAELDSQVATLQQQQDTLDASRSDLEAGAKPLELGEELLGYASGLGVVSEDESTAIVHIAFTQPRLELPTAVKQGVIDHFEGAPVDGVDVAFATDLAQAAPSLFGVGEALGLLFAAIVLIIMLGSLVASSLPIVTALVGVGVGLTASLAFSGVVDMPSPTPVLGLMLGLAVGIDYALFIINRHRKQLLAGVGVRESIGLANGTAGTAVVFAGSTVVVALLALNVTGIPFLGLMGTVGAVCVAVAVLIAITLVPAVLGLLGERLLSRRARARVGRQVVVKPARPMSTLCAVLTVVASIIGLLVIALPALSMRLGLPDGSSEPEGSTSAQAFEIVRDEFGAGANGPLLVSATVPGGVSDEDLLATQVDIARTLAEQVDVVAVAPIATSEDGTLLAFQVLPADGPNSVSTAQLVQALRALPPLDGNITLGVAGQAATNIDISDGLSAALPIYLAVVVGLSLLIMLVVFRSLLVPLIATGGFILSLLATYGLLTAVFQFGWGADLIGLHSTGPILSFLPIILVGILFGLAMDYQLFLTSGMREAYMHGSSARLAVAQGFRAGKSVVIAAALIMIGVFGGFIFSESTIVRSLGFGLAFGVLMDAFVVRMLLMPALMHLLGRAAWWLPRRLDRILPHVDIEGASLRRSTVHVGGTHAGQRS